MSGACPRPGKWEEIARSGDEEASAAGVTTIAMHDIRIGRSDLTDEAIDDIGWLAPVPIPVLVAHIDAWTKPRGPRRAAGDAAGGGWFGTGFPPAFGRKAGGDEPCPCGSGRTYRRCCGAN